MSDLHIRPATEADLTTLVRLRDDAARWMASTAVPGQWRPGELDEEHFRRIIDRDEVWLAEDAGRVVGAWELWWADEDAWGPQPPVAGYVHRLMVDRATAAPGTGRLLLEAAEARVSEAGRSHVRLDCLAGNAPLNAYYQRSGYRVVGHKEGKPQPGGAPKSFTLLEKELSDGAAAPGPGGVNPARGWTPSPYRQETVMNRAMLGTPWPSRAKSM
ncbi:GNAT family N-acetyltransferase [Streptomyces sp. 2RAF24]|uniref:GNAT family N-acetyltransferase n=1 Tax=Streptomyces sp. 2RAF24 TaxID=3232997 RepID=UPI003F96B889